MSRRSRIDSPVASCDPFDINFTYFIRDEYILYFFMISVIIFKSNGHTSFVLLFNL